MSESSTSVLEKTVRQLRKAEDRSNKVRFLGFHKTVQEAGAVYRSRKFGERMRLLQSRREKLIEKEKQRRAELGLLNIKIPKKPGGVMSEENKKKFIKICQPIQYSPRKTRIQQTQCSPRKPARPQPQIDKFSSRKQSINISSCIGHEQFKFRKSYVDHHAAAKQPPIPVNDIQLQTGTITDLKQLSAACLFRRITQKLSMSYSRFLCNSCKEDKNKPRYLKKSNSKSKENYVPIQFYDRPPHSWPSRWNKAQSQSGAISCHKVLES